MKNFIEELPKPILIEDLGMSYSTPNSKQKSRYGLYKCGFCGTEAKIVMAQVKRGHTLSCGCYHKRRLSETHKTHGLRSSKLYMVWASIKSRTLNLKTVDYINYGGRGITICDEWKNDFMSFYIWAMSNGYSDELSIDRIDNNGNYEPSNCRWTTKSIQSRNKRIQTNNTSGYKGVYYLKANKKFKAQIRVNKKNIHLGLYLNVIEGAVAYNNYIIENNLEGFPLNKLPDSHIHLQLPTKPNHQTLK